MAYMVSTSLNVHWVNRVEARSNSDGVLTLTFSGDPEASQEQNNTTDVTVFMENDELAKRLVAAINSADADRQPHPADPAFTPYHSWKGEDDESAF